MSLNPCVVEEILKRYVAYKAKTNFVDVVPQSKTLRLPLNAGFHEIDDPQGLCKDVSGLGRWGNGDVEVRLTKLDELPYAMALVRQSFERQMGNGAGRDRRDQSCAVRVAASGIFAHWDTRYTKTRERQPVLAPVIASRLAK